MSKLIIHVQTMNYIFQKAMKRTFDIIIASCFLILLLPVFILVAILIKLTSREPIFYRWKLMGEDGKGFTSYKFRTVCVDADHGKKELLDKNEIKRPVFKLKDDPRVTPIGGFSQKFGIDEGPQLYSVVKGDTSLIGPRPPLECEYE